MDLAPLDGARVEGRELELWMGPKKIGGRYFRLRLDDRPFVEGLAYSGLYPGQNWAEIFGLTLPDGVAADISLAPYLRPLADLIPPGGHLMIEYEDPVWSSTQLGLLAGVPPAETPLGALLAELGLGDSYKDWYFPEGGQEGGRKLQGNKAL